MKHWEHKKLAHKMGYEYAILFPRARDAVAAYLLHGSRAICLPTNICPALVNHLRYSAEIEWAEVDPLTGIAEDSCVQLYGYRHPHTHSFELDPLMTGWGQDPLCDTCVVSFGVKKFISIGYGGALLTNHSTLYRDLLPFGHWRIDASGEDKLIRQLNEFTIIRERRRGHIDKWDAVLGDLLTRIPTEQVIPWRVMRRVPNGKRETLLKGLRALGIAAGTNYPPIEGHNQWGDEVINFFPEADPHFAAHLIHGY